MWNTASLNICHLTSSGIYAAQKNQKAKKQKLVSRLDGEQKTNIRADRRIF
jgi:hypothetical protein